VLGVVPPYGIFVEANDESLERLAKSGDFIALEDMIPADKISPSLKKDISRGADELSVTVVPLCKDDSPSIREFIEKRGAKIVSSVKSAAGAVRANVPPPVIRELSERGDVRWIERFSAPELLVDEALGPGVLNVASLHRTYGLTGKGQCITISDSGLDTGDERTLMEDFKGRIGFLIPLQGCLGYDQLGHGTHVAGIALGNGALSGGWFKGVAYEARLNFIAFMDALNKIYLPEISALLAVYPESPSYIHSCSWGGRAYSEYTFLCSEFDSYLWSNPSVLAVVAAGNESSGRSIYEPGGAKNALTVGASENRRPYKDPASDNPSQVAQISSKGPMTDGRIKPDLCAPGTYIVSTRSTMTSSTAKGLYPGFERYMFDTGTSMATPFVSGCAALVRQWLVERRGIPVPSAALMKAVLTGGANDMSRLPSGSAVGSAPNSHQGWGRVDLGRTLYPDDSSVMVVDRIAFSQGSSYSLKITVTNSSPISVQLVWIDYPCSAGAARSLVNNLDLVVSNEKTVWYGNGVEGGDGSNTVESVRIPSDDVEIGVYNVLVKGTYVWKDSTEGGAAALYIRGAFKENVHDSWEGDKRDKFDVRRYMMLAGDNGFRWKYGETKVSKGEVLHFTVPESIPQGVESIDVTGEGQWYKDSDGNRKPMQVQRLGRIELADPGAETGKPITNEFGHMASSFSLTVDRDVDLLFRFFDEGSTNAASKLPEWWYSRYVRGDPLADTVRFTAVSPRRLEWTGGAAHHLALERSRTLGDGAQWETVFERPPAAILTNEWAVPAEFSTNSFFRIR
jgi:hypothetical protein